jgi:hypothetical protein
LQGVSRFIEKLRRIGLIWTVFSAIVAAAGKFRSWRDSTAKGLGTGEQSTNCHELRIGTAYDIRSEAWSFPGCNLARKAHGPGPAKTKALAIGRSRTLELWQSSDYRLRELFEAADVMSEGATRSEPDGSTYYGSTSVLLHFSAHGGVGPKERARELARLIANDPHARIRAIRIACLEAQIRSGAPIGRVRAELFVRPDARGIRVDVDVEARVFKNSERPRAPRKVEPGSPKRPSRAS